MPVNRGYSRRHGATITDLATGKTYPIETLNTHSQSDRLDVAPVSSGSEPDEHGSDGLTQDSRRAERNRGWLESRNVFALNLLSSPGAGKTTLLERTIRDLGPAIPISVVEGDQETVFDARRIRATGCKSVQVNTGSGCYLEAGMLAQALRRLDPMNDSLVMVENVGNLACPAPYDLGEAAKIAILSVTEGSDKPLKYPQVFRASRVLVLSKVDLLPFVDFDVDAAIEHAREMNPEIEVFQVSATTGQGMQDWYDWLQALCPFDPGKSLELADSREIR